mmetsp:Transcript_119472/g.372216  ORF Transcript_119472/g.372216 Transcript_119472/m.372216 type:complete len:353 (+) Transcript_119472:225-1283(+)
MPRLGRWRRRPPLATPNAPPQTCPHFRYMYTLQFPVPAAQYAACRANSKPVGALLGSGQRGRDRDTTRVPSLTSCRPSARRATEPSSRRAALTKIVVAWCHCSWAAKASPQCKNSLPWTAGGSRIAAATASWWSEGHSSIPHAAPSGTRSAHTASTRPTPLPKCSSLSPASGAKQATKDAQAGNDNSAALCRSRCANAGEEEEDEEDGDEAGCAAQKAEYNGQGTFCTSRPAHCKQRPPAPWLHRTTSGSEKLVMGTSPPVPNRPAPCTRCWLLSSTATAAGCGLGSSSVAMAAVPTERGRLSNCSACSLCKKPFTSPYGDADAAANNGGGGSANGCGGHSGPLMRSRLLNR